MLDDGSSPLGALRYLARSEGVLGIITQTEGAAYREPGAVMAFGRDGARVGSLSSGCIEDDLWEHAQRALAQGLPVALRYGTGSAFFDLQLPCGGGMSVLLVPRPDRAILTEALAQTRARQPARLTINTATGALSLGEGEGFALELRPELRFMVFGQGIEAQVFARLAGGAGFEVDLFGRDFPSGGIGGRGNVRLHVIDSFRGFQPPQPDRWAAVTLFFHSHDHEAGILAQLLGSEAFYIGAQGSRRAKDRLLAELRAVGLAEPLLARFRDRFGLIPSCRDPRTLAVSVLADVLGAAAKPPAPDA
ncbi:MAG: XdhC family protein [Rhodobacteraceae bacterium]|nr:XdhC family protein [Paracoccaceae bacterium]